MGILNKDYGGGLVMVDLPIPGTGRKRFTSTSGIADDSDVLCMDLATKIGRSLEKENLSERVATEVPAWLPLSLSIEIEIY